MEPGIRLPGDPDQIPNLKWLLMELGIRLPDDPDQIPILQWLLSYGAWRMSS